MLYIGIIEVECVVYQDVLYQKVFTFFEYMEYLIFEKYFQ